MVGPRADELGLFGTLISRFWQHGSKDEAYLRARGEAESLDLVQDLRACGKLPKLAALEVDQALAHLWPRLRALQG
jgi:hypothetical protein